MKKLSKSIGIIGALLLLIGGIFKDDHYFGADLMLLLGIMLLIIFIIIWVNFTIKNANTKKEKYALITLAIFLVLASVSIYFKVQHYNEAGIMLLIYLVIFTLVLIPVYYVYLNSKEDECKKNGRFSFLIFYIAFTGLIIAKGCREPQTYTSKISNMNTIVKECHDTIKIKSKDGRWHDTVVVRRDTMLVKKGKYKLI